MWTRFHPRRTAGLVLAALLVVLSACGGERPDAPGDEQAVEEEDATRPTTEQRERPGARQEPDRERQTQRRTAEEEEETYPTIVPVGTTMRIELDETLSTKSHDANDRFGATLTNDVMSNGAVLVPGGAEVTGVVTQSRRSTGPDEPAVLAFRLNSIQIDGRDHPLIATVQSAEPKRTEGDSGSETAAKIAIGTAAGAVLGQILGGDTESTLKGAAAGAVAGSVVALTTRKGDAELSEGSMITVQLQEPLRLQP